MADDTRTDDTSDAPPVVTAAIAFLKFSKEATDKQRDRERAALRFQVPSEQWDADARAARGAVTVDGVTIPGRPMLAIPKLNQPIQLLLNQEKAAHLGVTVSPLSEEADDDTAETIQDLYRREEQRSRAGLARSWGFDRAVKAGFGCYRLNTIWDDESNNPFDQRIAWQRILHQDAVYFDPSAQEPDWSDGQEALVASWVVARTYKRDYPKSKLAACDEGELAALIEEAPEWVTITEDEGHGRAYLVAEYFRMVYTPKVWVVLDDGSFSYEDEIPKGRELHPNPKVSKRREIQVPKVVWSKVNALEELETEELNGKYIPLIPVVGVELQPYDKERRWQGVIEPAMDGQRMFNHAASNVVEIASAEAKTSIVMYEGQEEGHEDQWRQSAVRRFPYLLVKPTSLDGKTVLPLPQLLATDTSKLAVSMALLDRADQFIQAATTTIDQSRIEQMGRKRVAHQTIEALQDQSEAGNSHFLHNLATITLPYEAKVFLDLVGKIYDRPGRIARLLDGEDNERTVMLNAPFTVDEKGRPQQATDPSGKNVREFDLRKGSYGVNVTIGKSWQTRLRQGSDEIGSILQASPELMPLIGPTYFKFRDFPGSKEIAELLKKMRAKQFPGLDTEDGDQPDAQALQAQVQAMQGQMQQLQQQLQQAGQIIQTEQVKQQAQVETAKVKADADLQAKQIEASLKERLEQMKIDGEYALQQLKGKQQAYLQDDQQAHELGLAGADTAAEKEMAQFSAKAAERQAVTQAALEPQAPTNGNGE